VFRALSACGVGWNSRECCLLITCLHLSILFGGPVISSFCSHRGCQETTSKLLLIDTCGIVPQHVSQYLPLVAQALQISSVCTIHARSHPCTRQFHGAGCIPLHTFFSRALPLARGIRLPGSRTQRIPLRYLLLFLVFITFSHPLA